MWTGVRLITSRVAATCFRESLSRGVKVLTAREERDGLTISRGSRWRTVCYLRVFVRGVTRVQVSADVRVPVPGAHSTTISSSLRSILVAAEIAVLSGSKLWL